MRPRECHKLRERTLWHAPTLNALRPFHLVEHTERDGRERSEKQNLKEKSKPWLLSLIHTADPALLKGGIAAGLFVLKLIEPQRGPGLDVTWLKKGSTWFGALRSPLWSLNTSSIIHRGAEKTLWDRSHVHHCSVVFDSLRWVSQTTRREFCSLSEQKAQRY